MSRPSMPVEHAAVDLHRLVGEKRHPESKHRAVMRRHAGVAAVAEELADGRDDEDAMTDVGVRRLCGVVTDLSVGRPASGCRDAEDAKDAKAQELHSLISLGQGAAGHGGGLFQPEHLDNGRRDIAERAARA